MRTRTPSENALDERSAGCIKPEVRGLSGYPAPPQGEMIAKLNQNENPYDLPPEMKDEILESMRSLEWTRYPVFDPPELRQKLSARFGLNPDQILLGNGSNQLIYLLGSAIVSPGRQGGGHAAHVLALRPGRPHRATDGSSPWTRIRISPSTRTKCWKRRPDAKLTFLCSPNNPTGQAIPISFLENVLKRRGRPGRVGRGLRRILGGNRRAPAGPASEPAHPEDLFQGLRPRRPAHRIHDGASRA